MKIFVTVKPGVKREEIKSADGTHMKVSVKAQPHEGKANEAVIKALAEHFGVAPSRVRVAGGHTGRKKIIEIL